jgi:oxygen-independent coproporphyrinogen-3 oxidase
MDAGNGTEADMQARPPLAIYVHWPFCRSKCPYCDFNSEAAAEIDQRRWRRALGSELSHFAAATAGRMVTSVFFGGGTPSLMDPDTVAALVGTVRNRWPTADDLEITLEANPNAAEADRFQQFRDAGVNRLSVGAQSFDDEVLAFLGRTHSAAEARRAVAAAAERFPRVSFDLIYAWPGQSVGRWRQELRDALALAGEHLSLYQLGIEPGTEFHRRGIAPTAEDTAADLFEFTQETMTAAGLPAYEISNHARPGAACRYNLAVWQGEDYLGIGPGAHGRVRFGGAVHALAQQARPQRWLAAVEGDGHATAVRRRLNRGERIEELLLLGLRLAAGIDRKAFRRLSGEEIENAVDPGRLAGLVEAGFVDADVAGLRVTAAGQLRLDGVLRTLLA